MSKRNQALWPIWPYRPGEAQAEAERSLWSEEQWSQEEERHRLELQKKRESAQERIMRINPGYDFKRLLS